LLLLHTRRILKLHAHHVDIHLDGVLEQRGVKVDGGQAAVPRPVALLVLLDILQVGLKGGDHVCKGQHGSRHRLDRLDMHGPKVNRQIEDG